MEGSTVAVLQSSEDGFEQMMTQDKKELLLLCLGLLFLAACTQAPAHRSPLLGTWGGESQNAAGSAFEFRADGTATWRLDQPFDIRYRVDDPLAPAHLDLFGFQTGPLKERTLYCLIDLVDNRLRMDCEPSERPGSLNPEQTQVFIRKSGATNPESANVRREIQASLQRTVEATLAEDVDAYMAELPPDLKIHDESGAIVTREQQRANILRDWSVIQKTISLTHTIDDISIQGDTATVTTSQRWERLMLRPDGQTVDTVLTTQRHEETWRRYDGRWYGYDIKELGGEIRINGKPYTP